MTEMTAHCPDCDGTEFYAEMEGSCSGWAQATIEIKGDKAVRVVDNEHPDYVEFDYWHTTGIIQCDRCQSDFTREKLVIKNGGEEVDLGPQPGPGQIDLLTGGEVR